MKLIDSPAIGNTSTQESKLCSNHFTEMSRTTHHQPHFAVKHILLQRTINRGKRNTAWTAWL